MITIKINDSSDEVIRFHEMLNFTYSEKEILVSHMYMLIAEGELLKTIQKQYGTDCNSRGIFSQYTYSIPMVKGCEKMIWCGDIAKIILLNLKIN